MNRQEFEKLKLLGQIGVPRAKRDNLLKDNFISSQEISFTEMKKYPEDGDNNDIKAVKEP
jgi:hypothetical protein